MSIYNKLHLLSKCIFGILFITFHLVSNADTNNDTNSSVLELYQRNSSGKGGDWGLKLTFNNNGSGFPTKGQFEFRNLKCGGDFETTINKNSLKVELKENMTFGNNCLQGCKIILKSDLSGYEEFCDGQISGTGNFEDYKDKENLVALLKSSSVFEIAPSTNMSDNELFFTDATGLIWTKCRVGETWDGSKCTGDVKRMPWPEAVAYADNANFAGKGDWRLPTLKEGFEVAKCPSNSPKSNLTIDGKEYGYDCTPGGWFGTITFWTITHTKQTLLERWSLDEKYRFAQVEGVRYNSSPATHGVRLVRHENQSSNSYWNEAKSTALPMLAEQQAKLASEERAKAEKARKEAEEKRRYEAQMAAEEKAFQRVLSNKSPQSMYLAAGTYARNGERGRATVVYEKIISRFPNSNWAVKASDQLSGFRRADENENRKYQESSRNRQSCENQKSACIAQCPPSSNRGFSLTSDARETCMGHCFEIKCD